MTCEDSHISDQWLLRDLEGELPARDQARVRTHLEACWECRGRRKTIEDTIAEFMRLHQREFEGKLPSADGPRALLKAQLAQFSAASARAGQSILTRPKDLAWAGAACLLVAFSLLVTYALTGGFRPETQATTAFSLPNSRLTPGAALLLSRQAVCSQANFNNKAVSAALRHQVFQEYGIATAAPQAYEVDYLVTPALGGADDLRNLWPHSYLAIWNAHVKDALEDRMREMVCDGNLDLAVAQREIAENWIAAYKKYFQTEQPLDER